MTREYDCIVVGAGVAGGAVAKTLADAGRKVALVESWRYGGTCPLRGCNPKKILLAAAETVDRARHMRGNGVRGELAVDWKELQRFKDGFLDGLPERIEQAYAGRGIDTIHARARFTGPNTIDADGDALRAPHIFLAPGASPRRLGIPGEELVTLSDAFLDLPELPPRVVFIGGGYISFEFAHLCARAGAKPTILHRSARPLKGYDPQMVDTLAEATREAGIALHTDTPVHAVERRGDGFVVLGGANGDQEYECDLVVHGAGRTPDLDGLDLETGGVSTSEHGILVDEYLQNSDNPAVYAAGDAAATPYALTPSANNEGTVAAHNILTGNTLRVDQAGIPRVVFSIPPLVAIGLSEADAAAKGMRHDVHTGDLTDWLPWQRLGETHGAYKVLTADGGRILGAHLVGHHADELANILAMAVRLGLTVDEVQRTVWAYPTSGYYTQYILPH